MLAGGASAFKKKEGVWACLQIEWKDSTCLLYTSDAADDYLEV